MAIDPTAFGDALNAAVSALVSPQKENPQECWRAASGALVSRIQTKAMVTIGGTPASVALNPASGSFFMITDATALVQCDILTTGAQAGDIVTVHFVTARTAGGAGTNVRTHVWDAIGGFFLIPSAAKQSTFSAVFNGTHWVQLSYVELGA